MDLLMMALIFFLLPFLFQTLILKFYINIAHKKGIIAPDAHKPGNPLVANRGGITFLATIVIFYPLALLFFTMHGRVPVVNEILATVTSFIIGFIIGFLDDLKDLGLKKVILSPIAAIPFLLLRAYYPKPVIPFIGPIRLTIIYPLILLVAFAIVPNGSNMVDVHNGTLATSVLAVLIPLAIWSLILGDIIAFSYILIGLALTLGFFVYNKYPAKVFAGNIGSYSLGTLLISLIVLSRLEFIAIIAWLPTVLTGFYIISSIGGLMTKEKIAKKKGKTVIVKNGILYPSLEENAPISLSRLILLEKGPMDEKSIIREYYKIYALSATLAIISGFFTYL